MEDIHMENKNGDYSYFICPYSDEIIEKTLIIKSPCVLRASFKNSDTLEHVSFDGCKKIEEYAFEDCKDLKTVIWQFEKSPVTNGEKESLNILDLVFPDQKMIEIHHGAFRDCNKLTTVIIPPVTKNLIIEKEAFAGCTNLRTIVFRDIKNAEISYDAFIGCKGITFLCPSGSIVERYARENEFRIVNL